MPYYRRSFSRRVFPLTEILGRSPLVALLTGASLSCSLTASPELERPSFSQAEPRPTNVAVGDWHSCALASNQRVACWGDNGRGQLGRADAPTSSIPVWVEGLSDIQQLVSSGSTSCARRSDGRVLCWGDNSHGQANPSALKVKSPELPSNHCQANKPSNARPRSTVPRPTVLADIGVAKDVALGRHHGCALRLDGRVHCWGDASRGQLGSSGIHRAFESRMIEGLPKASEVASAGDYSCMRSGGGQVWCWGGANDRWQLGSRDPGPSPRKVLELEDAASLLLTPHRACARRTNDEVACWSHFGFRCGQLYGLSGLAVVRELKASRKLLQAPGSCFACQLNDKRQLECGHTPAVSGEFRLEGVAAVDAGKSHGCAVLTNGGIRCFGSNYRGELSGSPLSVRFSMPQPVAWPPPAAGKAMSKLKER